jgi:hypothetical protein
LTISAFLIVFDASIATGGATFLTTGIFDVSTMFSTTGVVANEVGGGGGGWCAAAILLLELLGDTL